MAQTIGSLDLNAFSDLYDDSTQYFWFESNASATYGAGAHVTLVPDTSFISNPTGQNILMNTDGFSIRNGLLPMMILDDDSLDFNVVDTTAGTYTTTATFAATSAQIGQSSAAHSVIDANGQRFYGGSDGTTQLANIGYGEGQAETGTAVAPYYTFGTRASDTASTKGNLSVAEGNAVEAGAFTSHAEGYCTRASGNGAHVEGYGTQVLYTSDYSIQATGVGAHAEGYGYNTFGKIIASGDGAHAEGYAGSVGITASGSGSHAEGESTTASGDDSHAEGFYTKASGVFSHSQNYCTVAQRKSQTALGEYNIADTGGTDKTTRGNYAVIVGNGTSTTSRSNALTVDWDGNVIGQAMAGIIQMYAGSTPPSGWLVCDGSAISRSTYPELYSVIGTTYGAGDGTSTFNLPDFRGRVGVGTGEGTADGATNHSLNDKGGNEDMIVPYHNHSVSAVTNGISGGNHNHTYSHVNTTTFKEAGDTTQHTSVSSVSTANTGGTGAHNHNLPAHNTNYEGTSGNTVGANMMPYIGINYIICTGKTS